MLKHIIVLLAVYLMCSSSNNIIAQNESGTRTHNKANFKSAAYANSATRASIKLVEDLVLLVRFELTQHNF